MRAKLVFEADNQDNSRNMLNQLIEDNVRTKNTRAKLTSYLDKIYSFDENNPNIDKKELTKIQNDFFGYLFRSMFGMRETQEQYREDFEDLVKEAGYKDSWDATNVKKDKDFQAIQFYAIYSFSDIIRKYNHIQNLKKTSLLEKFLEKWYPNLEELNELAQKIEEIRKVVQPTPQEKKDREVRVIKGRINPEIQNAIDEIAENFRKVIEENEYERFIRYIESFKQKFPNGANDNDKRDRKNEFLFHAVSYFLIKQNLNLYNSPSIIMDNAEEKARKIAYNISVDTIKSWQFKMYNKLGGFMSELNKKFKTTVLGNRLRENDIIFNFEDESKFSIRNKIVDKVSHLGTYFYTYPTTFHNAYLPDGTKIANPNEYTVKKAFNDFKNH
jgi:hypothetical protein